MTFRPECQGKDLAQKYYVPRDVIHLELIYPTGRDLTKATSDSLSSEPSSRPQQSIRQPACAAELRQDVFPAFSCTHESIGVAATTNMAPLLRTLTSRLYTTVSMASLDTFSLFLITLFNKKLGKAVLNTINSVSSVMHATAGTGRPGKHFRTRPPRGRTSGEPS